jgi:hypothetical protein
MANEYIPETAVGLLTDVQNVLDIMDPHCSQESSGRFYRCLVVAKRGVD